MASTSAPITKGDLPRENSRRHPSVIQMNSAMTAQREERPIAARVERGKADQRRNGPRRETGIQRPRPRSEKTHRRWQ